MFKPFSTGDYFRSVVAQANKKDEFTLKMQQILNSGAFVDDQLVVDIVKNLKENPEEFMDGAFANTRGLILDGMPRTV